MKPEKDISAILGGTLRNSLERERAGILEIIKAIIFLIQNGLPLRGHRDSGRIATDELNKSGKGLFRNLLNYSIASGNVALNNHLENADLNARYLSPLIQNEFINIIGDFITSKIKDEIKSAKFFSISIDETQDIAKIEQLALTIRYFSNSRVNECFIKIIDSYQNEISLTGENISKMVLRLLDELNLNKKHLMFVSVDGASVMRGEINGFAAHFKRELPHVVIAICTSHSINNSIKSGFAESGLTDALNLSKEIVNFFRFAKRNNVLRQFTDKKLKSFCITRWSDQLPAIDSVIENLPEIVSALEFCLVSEGSKMLKSTATELLQKIRFPEAILPIIIAQKILSVMHPLVKVMQKVNNTYDDVKKYIEATVCSLRKISLDQQEWNAIYIRHLKISAQIEATVNRRQITDSVSYGNSIINFIFIFFQENLYEKSFLKKLSRGL